MATPRLRVARWTAMCAACCPICGAWGGRKAFWERVRMNWVPSQHQQSPPTRLQRGRGRRRGAPRTRRRPLAGLLGGLPGCWGRSEIHAPCAPAVLGQGLACGRGGRRPRRTRRLAAGPAGRAVGGAAPGTAARCLPGGWWCGWAPAPPGRWVDGGMVGCVVWRWSVAHFNALYRLHKHFHLQTTSLPADRTLFGVGH